MGIKGVETKATFLPLNTMLVNTRQTIMRSTHPHTAISSVRNSIRFLHYAYETASSSLCTYSWQQQESCCVCIISWQHKPFIANELHRMICNTARIVFDTAACDAQGGANPGAVAQCRIRHEQNRCFLCLPASLPCPATLLGVHIAVVSVPQGLFTTIFAFQPRQTPQHAGGDPCRTACTPAVQQIVHRRGNETMSTGIWHK